MRRPAGPEACRDAASGRRSTSRAALAEAGSSRAAAPALTAELERRIRGLLDAIGPGRPLDGVAARAVGTTTDAHSEAAAGSDTELSVPAPTDFLDVLMKQVVSERQTRPPKEPRSVTASRIQPASLLAAVVRPFGQIAHSRGDGLRSSSILVRLIPERRVRRA